MYYVYMLRCQDGSLYTGTAADLHRRMHAHTAKTPACARYTRSHPPAAMEAAWQTEMRADALRLEALIKPPAPGAEARTDRCAGDSLHRVRRKAEGRRSSCRFRRKG